VDYNKEISEGNKMKEQRPFLFRAYNRATANMYWFDLTWGNYENGNGWIGMLPIGETDKSKRIQVDPDDCDIMQYLDILDEKGNRICEGDIYRLPWGNILTCVIEYSTEERFVTKPKIKGGWAFAIPGVPKTGEVIGNIYQNSDILEAVE
jgi:hypothetical protein